MIFILLPAYNEKPNLLKILKKIKTLQKKKNYKITVVLIDDGSSDGTDKILIRSKKI